MKDFPYYALMPVFSSPGEELSEFKLSKNGKFLKLTNDFTPVGKTSDLFSDAAEYVKTVKMIGKDLIDLSKDAMEQAEAIIDLHNFNCRIYYFFSENDQLYEIKMFWDKSTLKLKSFFIEKAESAEM